MHFIIGNIPEQFRSSDLRNFFFESVESETFNCFHFRHRPQTNLLSILKSSSRVWNSDKSHLKDDSELDVDYNNLGSVEITLSKGKKSSQSCRSKLKDDKSSDSRYVCISEERESGRDCTPPLCVESKVPKKTGLEDSENNHANEEDEGKVKPNYRTHWLNSGLSGLASLIGEKKLQLKQSSKWSRDAEERTYSRLVKGDDGSEGNKTKQQSSSCLPDVLSLTQREGGSKRTCCVVEVKDALQDTFTRKYDRKHWLNRSGDILPQRCYLLRVDFANYLQNDGDEDYMTRKELSTRSLVSCSPQELLEFRPPPIMPQGNVGTPTRHFRNLIRACKMPGALIRKLGLEFPRVRGKRRFGQVPFDYGTSVVCEKEDSKNPMQTDIAFTASGHLIPTSADFENQQRRRREERKERTTRKGPRMDLEVEREDGAEVEEWERYEPFHENVTSQDRIKERRYEEELEVVWEKGGPGLVFYTDAQFWRAQQGDFDEQTADEWDVDMSVYYEEGAGDKDARDGVQMRVSDKLRAGTLAPSVFIKSTARKETYTKRKKRKIGPTPPPAIGKFEAHTRGFGRRLMEAQGWQEGQGLGVNSIGMPYALDGDGQHPHDRKGFGYHGEKLQAWTSISSGSSSSNIAKPPHRHHRISTVFDRPENADPSVPPLRTPEPTALSHRPR